MARRYVVSDRPVVSSNTVGMIAERGKRSRQDVEAFHARVKADRIHKNRSEGQRIRQARERLYGKDSHLVSIRRIEAPKGTASAAPVVTVRRVGA